MIVLEMRVVGASSQQPTEPNGNRIIGEWPAILEHRSLGRRN